jgi:uncharacterized membrane protein
MADKPERRNRSEHPQKADSAKNSTPVPKVELLPPDVREFVSALPVEKRGAATQVLLARFTSHTGPIPSPEALEQYGQTLPSAPDRILRMAEKQSDHRMEIEKQVVKRQLNQSGIGQFLAATIAVVCISSASWLALHDHDTVAGVIGGTTVVGLVTTFIYGKRSQQQDLKQKAK